MCVMDKEQRKIEKLVNAYISTCKQNYLKCLRAFKGLENHSLNLQEKYDSPQAPLEKTQKAS